MQMIAQTEKITLDGMVGPVEAVRNRPAGSAKGVAGGGPPPSPVRQHHAQQSGANPCRALVQADWEVVRFNFRGVGASVGEHDGGPGRAARPACHRATGRAARAVGTGGLFVWRFVTTHAVQALWSPERLQKIVLVGTAASRFDPAPAAAQAHERTLVLHGEQDDTVPLASVLDWARPQYCR